MAGLTRVMAAAMLLVFLLPLASCGPKRGGARGGNVVSCGAEIGHAAGLLKPDSLPRIGNCGLEEPTARRKLAQGFLERLGFHARTSASLHRAMRKSMPGTRLFLCCCLPSLLTDCSQLEEGEVDTDRSRLFSACFRKEHRTQQQVAMEEARRERENRS
eukprot:768016-Hanusia_phi.AAC.3